jgi:hypothetical protein
MEEDGAGEGFAGVIWGDVLAKVQRSTFNVQRSTFNVQRSTFNFQLPKKDRARRGDGFLLLWMLNVER